MTAKKVIGLSPALCESGALHLATQVRLQSKTDRQHSIGMRQEFFVPDTLLLSLCCKQHQKSRSPRLPVKGNQPCAAGWQPRHSAFTPMWAMR
jgi:hypothetical protein